MNTNGNETVFIFKEKTYRFDEFKCVITNKMEDTPLIGGGVYRVRSCGSPETLTLKARIRISYIPVYRALFKELAKGKCSFSINGHGYSDFILVSAKAGVDTGCQHGYCEIILSEVDD